jgi:hypothetical protein
MRSKIAAGEASRKRITERLRETREWLGVSEEYATAWLEVSYQAANRYAHLRWFLDVLNENAWLVNVYFVDDPDKPTSRTTWDTALDEPEKALGLAGVTVPNSGRVFLEAGTFAELLAPPTS